MKILKIIIKKEFFEAIKNGTKKQEFRRITKFWVSRLINKDQTEIIKYDFIEFINGYRKNAPRLLIEFKDVKINYKKGEFIIYLGNIKNK